jgi:4,5:9,10-diseco-3-hydroxy-5,9,17-trioxoandrosta-1(10),2-diene-4-oate hydrolase
MTNDAAPEDKFVDVGDGLTMRYVEAGTGFPVIFIHGSGPGASSLSNFKGNYQAFADAGYRAILVDSIGYGLSSMPSDWTYHMNNVTGTVLKLVDALGITECAVVGNSRGGTMALRMALDRPKLVKALVLLAPGNIADIEVYMAMPGIQGIQKVGAKGAAATLEDMRELFSLQLYNPADLSDDLLLQRLEIARKQPIELYQTMRGGNLIPELPLIKCPTLAFWGQNDNFCPISTAPALMENMPDVRMVQVTKCGHWVQVEYPQLFNDQTIGFLREKIPGTGR